MSKPEDDGPMPGYGPMPPYGGAYYPQGAPWGGAYPPHMWGAHPGFGAPPPYPPPPGYGPPPQPGAGANAGFAAAMGDLADSSGLGMFKNLVDLDDGDFWKGALVGAAVVLLMTNEDLRSSIFSGAAKTADAMKSGLAGFAAAQEAEETTAEEEPAQNQPEESGA